MLRPTGIDGFIEHAMTRYYTAGMPEQTSAGERHDTALPAGTTAIDCLIADLNGVMRGKRITPGALPKVLDNGINLPLSVFGTDITGKTVDATRLGYRTGDKDGLCRAVAGSLRPVPWTAEPSAQVLLSMYQLDGSPFWGDPRHALARVLERFGDLGLAPVVALETEFYLIDPKLDDHGRPGLVCNPVTGKTQRATQVYSIREIEDFADIVGDITAAAAAQGLPADAAVAEYAPGQFEINLRHVNDALLACDHLLLLRRLIRGVARKHGLDATFMAKPFADLAGNGLHAHVSLIDEDGKNVCAGDGEHGESAILRQGVAGLLDMMGESTLLFSPHANSFRRLQPGSFAPTAIAWGVNNRTTAIRIPAGRGKAMRLEHRLGSADANPYLMLAAILAGIHHGIGGKMDPPAGIRKNAYEQDLPTIPLDWLSAINAYRESARLAEYLGPEMHWLYDTVKRAEFDQFHAEILPLEYEWYLRAT